MGKKKEYKKPLLADHDAGENEYGSDPQEGFGTLNIENFDDEAAFTSQTSMFSSFDTDDDDSIMNSTANGGDEDIGESFRSVDSGHKRAARTRTSQRRSMRNLTQSPGTMSNSGRANRRCDRTRQDRKAGVSPGALGSRRSAAGGGGGGGGGTNATSPGALSRHSVAGSRGASNSPHHLRRGPRSRRRSMEEGSGHDAIEKGSQRGVDRRRAMAKSNSISPNMGTSMRMLYSEHGAKEGLATPDLDDQEEESDHADEFAGDDVAEEVSADDAELVRDELADLEGLIQAAKGVEISS